MELQRRERRVLEHIRRYRMTVGPVLDRWFYDGNSKGREKIMRALTSAEYTEAFELHGKNYYWRLGARGVKELGVPKKDYAGPLSGKEALADRYAVLGYCRLGTTLRTLLRQDEMQQTFPELCENLPRDRGQYVFSKDAAGKPNRLGLVLRDNLTEGKRVVERLVRQIKTRTKVNKHYWLLIAEQAFFITLVTTADEAAARIRKAVSQAKVSGDLTVDVETFVCPGLHLLV